MTRIAETEVLDLLTRLVEKSLVVFEEDDQGPGRYRLVETVRQYARERLVESDDAAGTRARHLEHFLRLAEAAAASYCGPGEVDSLEQLAREHDNLGAALDLCEAGCGTGAKGVRLGAALWHYWEVRNHFAEGTRRLEALLEWEAGAPSPRAKALEGAGTMAWLVGDYERAMRRFGAALCLYEALGDLAGLSVSLHKMGSASYCRLDYAGATELFEQSLQIAQTARDEWGVAGEYNALGEVARAQGNYERAAGFYEESLRRSRTVGDKAQVATAVYNLAEVRQVQGDFRKSAELHAESLSLWHELADRRWLALCLAGIAGLRTAQGDPESGARLLGFSTTLREALGAHLEPVDALTHERHLAATRAALDGDSFAVSWAEGQALGLDAAVALALAEETKP